MSFLNSVLSRITGEEAPNGTAAPPPFVPKSKPQPKPEPPPPTTASIDGEYEARLIDRELKLARKRKAEDALERQPGKASRVNSGPTITSKPKSRTEAQPGVPQNAFVPSPAKAPKKGSFAEIMKRAEAQKNSAKPVQVGVLQHKKTEVTKEKLFSKKAKLNGIKSSGNRSKANLSRSASPDDKKRKPKATKASDTGDTQSSAMKKIRREHDSIQYHGTAKPSSRPAYSGTARPAAESANPGKGLSRSANRRTSNKPFSQYKYASDEEDEEEDDYESDVSSDMEATGADLEQEELASTRIARREDDEALREENEHKREKELRKRRMMELAAKQRR